MNREYGVYYGANLKDMRGREINVGDEVVKSTSAGSLCVCKVTRIEAGKMYLDGSHVAVHYPGRLFVDAQAKVKAVADLLEHTIANKESLVQSWKHSRGAGPVMVALVNSNIAELQIILHDLRNIA